MPYDVTVLGAGPAGMIAMLRLAAAGFSVLGIEKNPCLHGEKIDLRSTAFLMPAIASLERAGLWEMLAPAAVALDVMEVMDASRMPIKSVPFEAFDIGQTHFGFNIANAVLHKALRIATHNNPLISMRYEDKLIDFKQFSDHVEMRFLSGARENTRLLIGAEGRNSPLREMLGIGTSIHEYDQWAQAFTVSHDLPHQNTSTEIHDMGGPFTTVPSPDLHGRAASAIVWMDTATKVKAYEKLSPDAFEQVVNARSHDIRGALKIESDIARFPMNSMEAGAIHQDRCVLIGESAHVVPPIGAQGLNMSLKDIETLTRACETGALQNPTQLSQWARIRMADIALRRRGIGALNAISIANFDRAKSLRQLGLWALEKDTGLKRGLMRLGLG